MNEPLSRGKGFRRFLATMPGLALFLSLSAMAPQDAAFAQYIPPPASQSYAPAQGVTTGEAQAPRASRSKPRRAKATRARSRQVETVEAEAPAEPRKARSSSRKSRAEARAAARAEAREKEREAAEERAQARAEARAAAAAKRKKTRAAAAAAKAAAANEAEEEEKQEEVAAPAPVAKQGDRITILAGDAQTTIARSADEIAGLAGQAGLDMQASTGKISLAQLSDPEGSAEADLAILQSDALEDARREGGPALMRKLTYIARLYNQEIHIVARAGVRNFADLHGRTVATGAPDTPEGRTAAKLFERAEVKPRLVDMDQATALARLGRGEIDAALFVGGKPSPAIAGITVAGLHLISIPYKGALQDSYYPAQLTRADYPNLITGPNGVDTIAIGTVLVALDAKPGSPRYKKLTQFTQTFFNRFGALRDGAHHPKWREVNLAADVPGWRRFQPAQKWLDTAPPPRLSRVK